MTRARLSLRDSFPTLFGNRWEEARQIYLDAFRAIHLERLQPLPGREALVRDLAAAGFYLGVVSNKTGSILRREAAKLGWDSFFTRLVGATDAAADKPAREPVDLALSGSGIEAGTAVWFVGDTAIDMKCALNSGCLPVLLGPPAPEDPDLALFKPVLAFEDGAGLISYLRTL
jgi:phosphoglycolate phosphatase